MSCLYISVMVILMGVRLKLVEAYLCIGCMGPEGVIDRFHCSVFSGCFLLLL